MSDDLEKAFSAFLRDLKGDLTSRQKLWLAWKAGAEWAMDEIRANALKRPIP